MLGIAQCPPSLTPAYTTTYYLINYNIGALESPAASPSTNGAVLSDQNIVTSIKFLVSDIKFIDDFTLNGLFYNI